MVKVRRPTAASRSESDNLPDDTPRSSEVSTRLRPRSAAAASISRTTTSSPARVQTSAIPAPIRPQPTTPIRVGVVWLGVDTALGESDMTDIMSDAQPGCHTRVTRAGRLP